MSDVPLTEREQGFNEAIAVVAKIFEDRATAYYAAMRVLDDESPEQTAVSSEAYRLRQYARDVERLRKRRSSASPNSRCTIIRV